ncbi:hypothetical protein ACHAQJ_007343 [Trichoderma viride]
MSKRTVFTSITPLPPGISRQTAIDFLHNHHDMIDLNPLVQDRHVIPPPPHALPEEHVCTWYSITDQISYLPGGLVTGAVSYTAAFHDLPTGLQTHCHAPMGVDLREKWSVAGSEPGEEPEPMELGLGAPRTGLYIREDVIITCNMVMAGFIKKTIKKAHGTLVEALSLKATTPNAQPVESYMQQQMQQQQQQRQNPPPMRIENKFLTKPLPARPTSWQSPPMPSLASFTAETYQYETDRYETEGLDRRPQYGYVEERMAPRTMATPRAYAQGLQ